MLGLENNNGGKNCEKAIVASDLELAVEWRDVEESLTIWITCLDETACCNRK